MAANRIELGCIIDGTGCHGERTVFVMGSWEVEGYVT